VAGGRRDRLVGGFLVQRDSEGELGGEEVLKGTAGKKKGGGKHGGDQTPGKSI